MEIKDALLKYKDVEIELLLMKVLGKTKEFLYMEPKYKLTSKQINKLTTLIKRRLSGEPMAYIFGYKDFYGLRFKVNKNVLIPRPETEMVVDVIASAADLSAESAAAEKGETIFHTDRLPCRLSDVLKAPRNDNTLKILDVGTGSGAIIISLASTRGILVQHKDSPCGFEFYGSDISAKALKIAKQNAKIHKVKAKFIKSDLLKDIKIDADIIIANLPYGWYGVKNRFSSVKDGLTFEPQSALYTKEKGLYEIRRLLEQIKQKKHQPKLIYLEFDPRQKTDLSKLIKKILPKSKTEFLKDFGNLWRYVIININK